MAHDIAFGHYLVQYKFQHLLGIHRFLGSLFQKQILHSLSSSRTYWHLTILRNKLFSNGITHFIPITPLLFFVHFERCFILIFTSFCFFVFEVQNYSFYPIFYWF